MKRFSNAQAPNDGFVDFQSTDSGMVDCQPANGYCTDRQRIDGDCADRQSAKAPNARDAALFLNKGKFILLPSTS